jgi:hypothetical protein
MSHPAPLARPRRPVVDRAPMSTACQAPCEPDCDKDAVATVEWQGRKVRVCYGHRKRSLLGQPIDVPLQRRSPKGAGAALAPLAVRLPAELKARVEDEATRQGITPSEAGHRAFELWLAQARRK